MRFSTKASSSTILALALFSLMAIHPGTKGLSGQGVHQVAVSNDGVVATAHPLATLAGYRTLQMGGNAADAAVASAFAVAVVLPSMNSIGGRNQIMVRSPSGEVFGIDGTTQVPAGYEPETAPRASYGYATIGIPGAVAGLIRLHQEHGSLPLERVMAPAIEYSEEGFRLLPQQEFFQAMGPQELAESEGARQYFLHADGSPYQAGDLLIQSDLAKTLTMIAKDRGESFYRGDMADRIAADMAANGGFVTAEDLATYEAEDSRVVRGSYRGYDIVGLDVPAAGAVCIQALQIMENFDPQGMRPEEWAAVSGQAIGLASRELGALGTDTAAARATSKDWARLQASRVIGPGGNAGSAPPSRAAALRDGDEIPLSAPEAHFTTHISIADSDGMTVALTQTVGPVMGSKVATPGLGFHYAVTLGGYLMGSGPGARARSFVSPLLILKEGEPILVLGAAGGEKIVSSVVQVASRVIDNGMRLPEAMAAPRVAMGFNGTLAMETSGPNGWSPEQIERVREMGIQANPSPGPVAFALVQALRHDPLTGRWTAVSEPDGEGTAMGVGRNPQD